MDSNVGDSIREPRVALHGCDYRFALHRPRLGFRHANFRGDPAKSASIPAVLRAAQLHLEFGVLLLVGILAADLFGS